MINYIFNIFIIFLPLVLLLFTTAYWYQRTYEPKHTRKQSLVAAVVIMTDMWVFVLVSSVLVAVVINGLLGGL